MELVSLLDRKDHRAQGFFAQPVGDLIFQHAAAASPEGFYSILRAVSGATFAAAFTGDDQQNALAVA